MCFRFHVLHIFGGSFFDVEFMLSCFVVFYRCPWNVLISNCIYREARAAYPLQLEGIYQNAIGWKVTYSTWRPGSNVPSTRLPFSLSIVLGPLQSSAPERSQSPDWSFLILPWWLWSCANSFTAKLLWSSADFRVSGTWDHRSRQRKFKSKINKILIFYRSN
jgi:hypothetical protein